MPPLNCGNGHCEGMLGTLNSTLDAHDPNGDCQLMRTANSRFEIRLGSKRALAIMLILRY
jgi:hypothetical protein